MPKLEKNFHDLNKFKRCAISRERPLSSLIVVFGVACFLSPFIASYIPVATKNSLFKNIELPASIDMSTIEAPDEKRYALINAFGRVQRYGTNGKFEMGWHVDDEGGGSLLGLTGDGNIAIASVRPRHLEIFSPEGRLLDQLQLPNAPWLGGTLLLPGEVNLEKTKLIELEEVENPKLSFPSLLLLPVSPFVGWLIALFGAILSLIPLHQRTEEGSS